MDAGTRSDGPGREGMLRELEARADVPVLILGGGINGCGLFRELALQGVDCVLVDRADFASGASSKSSRMIHGGLRYLENGEFRLVRESLAERNRLLVNAPHYVSPLETTIPLFSWVGGMLRSPLIFLGLPLKAGSRGGLIVKVDIQLKQGAAAVELHAASAEKPAEGLEGQLEHIEREAIMRALEQARYNKTRAAELLGMTFRQLRYRVKKLGIE